MAYDERFAIGVHRLVGEGGAKLHRRDYGETIENVAELAASTTGWPGTS